jgi:hypothetical protein
MTYDLRVLSLGAGVQSSALALMIEHGDIPPVDAAIFADTQAEPQEVYEWLDWLDGETSYPIYRVTAGNLEDDSLQVIMSKEGVQYWKAGLPTFMLKEGLGGSGMNMRKCTTDYKIVPIKRQIRTLLGRDWRSKNVLQYIGISTDEAVRMKPSQVKYITHVWPLIENNFSRNDCIKWMSQRGYDKPPRSACYFCPYHSNAEWKRIKNELPKYFQKAIDYERKMQAAAAQASEAYSTPYLHPSCLPLADAPLDDQQLNLFDAECEGLCGV